MKERILPEPERNQVCAQADQSILEFYKGKYESVFIVLHPFFQVINPNKIDFEKEEYPNKKQISKHCKKLTWEEVMKLSKIENIRKLDIALRNSIMGLKEVHKDDFSLNKMIETCDKNNIHQPNEGSFAELLIDPILTAILSLGHKWIYIGDEFGTERKLLFVEDVIDNTETIGEWYKNIFTPKNEILLSVHWDSHFSLLCSKRNLIDEILKETELEGFHCDEKTEIYWSCK